MRGKPVSMSGLLSVYQLGQVTIASVLGDSPFRTLPLRLYLLRAMSDEGEDREVTRAAKRI